MSTQHFTSLSAAAKAIAKDSIARERRVRAAVHKAAVKTAQVVARDIAPKAFGELTDSIHVEDLGPGAANVIADAPHAEAVEVGSRPHMPPLAPLVKWVRLRGIQGLTIKGNVRHQNIGSPKALSEQRFNTNVKSAGVALLLKRQLKTSSALSKWRVNAGLGAVDPATIAVAQAIQHMIAKNGTKPFRFMRSGIPTAVAFLDLFVKEALAAGP